MFDDQSAATVPPPRYRSIVTRLAALVGDLQHHPPPIETGLAELVDSASRDVPGAQHAGITLVGGTGDPDAITTVVATDHYPVVLDKIQQHHQEGPCLAAARQHQIMWIDDLAADDRWPQYRRDAVEQTPVRSSLSFELVVDNATTGAFNLHAERPRAFDEESIDLGLLYATHIAVAWSMRRRAAEFQRALASRDIIGQAKGVIMERFNVDAVHAFELLKKISQERNVKLVEIAQGLVEAEHPGPRR